MLFQLKENYLKNKSNQQNDSKVQRLKDILSKFKFVAKNMVYMKNWSKGSDLKNEKYEESINSRGFDILVGSFSIKIINDSHPLMIKVKELRQRIFFKNSTSSELDADEFDKYCDHLVVIDSSVSKDFVVGTYRLLFKPKNEKNQRFYSQSEFEISNLLENKKKSMLEAGRSCVHEKYRDGRIIKLLWRGLATYIINSKAELIFGCASFPSSDHRLFKKSLSYLDHFHSPPKHLQTFPVKKFKANFKKIDKNFLDAAEEFRKLPPLIKAYIRVGAWVGSGAIVDKKFNTTDVLIILESKKILTKYAQLSFGKLH
ncbi:MAG: GNAT family N-acetyltransferase [Alphaproteobacteria bacterium]